MCNGKEDALERMRVPILLPTGRDAELVVKMLDSDEIDTLVCRSMGELLDQIGSGCGPFIVADEAFSDDYICRLNQALDNQPEWSDLPGVILVGRPDGRGHLSKLAARREIILVHRPIKKSLFANIVQSAIEARRRQYQVRDLLEDLVQTNEKLRSRTELLQKLALELTRAETNERKRIAQILHDDLQQLLASARLQTEIILNDLSGEMAQKTKPVYDIISQAMNASRSLSHELNPAFVIAGNLAEALEKMGNRISEEYGFRIHTAIEIGRAAGDEDLNIFIFRSVRELLFNCAKHAQARHVSLELSRQGKFLTITAADDGVGFDPDRLRVSGGVEGGFGLFSIQERTMALGGSFDVHSVAGKGSRFVLTLPFYSEKPKTTEPAENEGHWKTDVISVVIADDHAVMRQGLATLLHNQPDIKVIAEASDGEQAVALTLQLNPDVVLMDFSMPLLNGAEATRLIKNEAPDIAVIGLSMYGGEDKRKRMHDAGAQAYLKKDVQAGELISAIKRHAGHP